MTKHENSMTKHENSHVGDNNGEVAKSVLDETTNQLGELEIGENFILLLELIV